MKLSKKKILWIIRLKEKQESSGIIAKIQHITHRRVDQLWKIYLDTGTVPVIGQQTRAILQGCSSISPGPGKVIFILAEPVEE